jgi:hypothetical protein
MNSVSVCGRRSELYDSKHLLYLRLFDGHPDEGDRTSAW